MKGTIYLDNAATTFPKPEQVYNRMDYINRNMTVNTGRGSYYLAREASKIIDETKVQICEMVSAKDKSHIVFSTSVTVALNQILNGLKWDQNDVIYVSPYEHNAVARTVSLLSVKFGLKIIEMPIHSNTMEIDMEALQYAFTNNHPTCICMTHISNVTGYILPIENIIKISEKYEPVIIVDAAQSLGILPIDLRKTKIDFLAFTGHKNLYGPFGIGGFVYNTNVVLEEFITGGTGSDSLNVDMPLDIPYRYEAGSPNIVAISGLNEALKWRSTIDDIFKKEKILTDYLVEKLNNIEEIKLYIPTNESLHIGIVSFNLIGFSSTDVGIILDEDYNIAVRSGFHCAPYIHKWLQDLDYNGTVRVSLGYFNTKDNIDILIKSIKELILG